MPARCGKSDRRSTPRRPQNDLKPIMRGSRIDRRSTLVDAWAKQGDRRVNSCRLSSQTWGQIWENFG